MAHFTAALYTTAGRSNERSPVQTGLLIRTGLPPAHSGRMVNTYQSVVSRPASVALTRTVWLTALASR